MKQKLRAALMTLFLVLGALLIGASSGEGAFRWLSGTVTTHEALKTEAAKKKKKKSKKNSAGNDQKSSGSQSTGVTEDGEYTSKDEVAAYIHSFGHLPSNFITKKEAKALGWVNSEGNLAKVAPGKSIGGDYFGNYEGQLPEAKGREYSECDIDSTGGYRGPKRIIFSNDGLIFYTEDHYKTFEQLY